MSAAEVFQVGRTYRVLHAPVSGWTVVKRTPKYVTLESDGVRVCKRIRRLQTGSGIVEGVWPNGKACSPVMADLEIRL